MPQDLRAEYCHEIMLRLFGGKLGEDIYDNVTVEGSKERQRVILQAYVGFYPDIKFFRFAQMVGRPMALAKVLRRIQPCRFTEDEIRQQHARVLKVRPDAKKSDTDSVLWAVAKAQTQPMELPTAFFTFVSTFQGEQKVIFWYPRMVPGHWMLEQLQQLARRAR